MGVKTVGSGANDTAACRSIRMTTRGWPALWLRLTSFWQITNTKRKKSEKHNDIRSQIYTAATQLRLQWYQNLQWSRLCPLSIIESYRDECLQNSDSPSFWETSRCSFAVGASANSWLHWWIYVFTHESGKLSDWTARRNATASATCSKIDGISTRKRKISTNRSNNLRRRD